MTAALGRTPRYASAGTRRVQLSRITASRPAVATDPGLTQWWCRCPAPHYAQDRARLPSLLISPLSDDQALPRRQTDSGCQRDGWYCYEFHLVRECELHFVFSPREECGCGGAPGPGACFGDDSLIEGPAPVPLGLLLVAGRLQPSGALNARRAATGDVVDGERGVSGGGVDRPYEILAMKVSL